MANAHTIDELHSMQAAPLFVKVRMTQSRIRDWVNYYGLDGVYVSFSGGKDSTVLLTIAREMYPDIKAVFADTGLEYPEIRDFVRTWDNVDWLKPKMTFRQVIEKYGYPFISKEASECVCYARKYLKSNGETYKEFYRKICGNGEFAKDGKRSRYSMQKFSFFLNEGAPMISHMCCKVMKKNPMNNYAKATEKVAITAEMASESRRRTTNWILHGCNMFSAQHPKSTPMAFWTEQDVLQYIKENNIKIASVYGDIVADEVKSENVEGQLRMNLDGTIEETECVLKTTGCDRTGCMFCGFGCHLEKPGQGRFERMKHTHPKQYDYIMRPWEKGGLGYKEVIDWINEHGNMNIQY